VCTAPQLFDDDTHKSLDTMSIGNVIVIKGYALQDFC
jgi:hypothetical protein